MPSNPQDNTYGAYQASARTGEGDRNAQASGPPGSGASSPTHTRGRPDTGHPPRPGQRAQAAGRRHLIDRAVEWARRLDRGESQADIRRSIPARSRPSRGYVSVVARLGHALKDLPPLEFELYRSPRVTLRLAQEIIRADTDTLAIRHRLRQAITALPHPADRKRSRRARSQPGDAPSLSRSRRSTDPDLFTWAWDGAQAERDPAGYVEEYVAFLERLHREATRRVRAALARRAAPPIAIAGQSLASLAASVTAYRRAQLGVGGSPTGQAGGAPDTRPPASGVRAPADRAALDRLERIGRAIEQVVHSRDPGEAPE